MSKAIPGDPLKDDFVELTVHAARILARACMNENWVKNLSAPLLEEIDTVRHLLSAPYIKDTIADALRIRRSQSSIEREKDDVKAHKIKSG